MNKEYDKLVRDNIPFLIEKSNKSCIITTLHNKKEITNYRQKKVLEEIEELKSTIDFTLYSNEEVLKELIDVIEIIWYYLYDKKITKSEINKLYDTICEKRSQNGAFDSNIVLKMVFDKSKN